jgi:hypothetical protein
LDTGAGAENGCEFDCRNGFAHPANKFADTFGITINTARNQIKRVFEKTDPHNHGQLISLSSIHLAPHVMVKSQ